MPPSPIKTASSTAARMGAGSPIHSPRKRRTAAELFGDDKPATPAAKPSTGARLTEAEKKWRRGVALDSRLAGGRPLPRVLGAVPLLAAAAALIVCVPAGLRGVVARSCGIGVASYFATAHLLPVIGAKIPAAKYGCDLLKRPAREPIAAADRTVPESLGLASGVVFVLALVITEASTPSALLSDHEYSAAMLAVALAILLGFADDVLDLEWKYKYALPPLMALPLLSAYSGGTTIKPPQFARALLVEGAEGAGRRTRLGGALHAVLEACAGGVHAEGMGLVELGYAYHVYMVLLAVFCTNAINIYAGVNGLEAGQAYVVGCAILVMSAFELASGNEEAERNHLFAVTLMLPFVGTTLALLRSNWFPASVFVGDTFTNYAGMALAVVAILGHFPVMLLLLMLPQVLNFLISIPQLFKLAPCPRHRLPTFDETTGLLRYSRVNDRRDTVEPARDGMNLTLICVALRALGPMTEPMLATVLLGLQAAVCAAGLWLRVALAGQIY